MSDERKALDALGHELDVLLMQEDITDEALRDASEGLLPRIGDAIRETSRELQRIREAMNAYPDSDLVSLAGALATRVKACDEAEEAEERWTGAEVRLAVEWTLALDKIVRRVLSDGQIVRLGDGVVTRLLTQTQGGE